MCLSPDSRTYQYQEASLSPTAPSLLNLSSSSMEEDKMEPALEEEEPKPEILSPSNSVRRRNSDPNSPEFEFCSFPQQPYLPSADELFVDGVLLPLDLVSHTDTEPKPNSVEKVAEPEPDPDPELSQPGPGPESAAVSSASKRWKDIFKIGEKKPSVAEEVKEKSKVKERKKDRKASVNGGSNGGVSSGAELNINIWPFSRSWSAGTGRNASKTGSVSRKVSSAPCSRSNSAGESKSRKWPNSPSRGGIHLGRHSPVWQVKRAGSGLKNTEQPPPPVRNVEKGEVRRSRSDLASRTRSLNLNVPMCIGYRQQLSCRRDENVLFGSDGGDGGENIGSGGAGSSLGGNKLFYLRTLFTKKVY